MDVWPIPRWWGVTTSPLLDFELRPVGAHCNWKNVLNNALKPLSNSTVMTNKDGLGTAVTNTLQRAIERQIEADNTWCPIPRYISPCSATTSHIPSNPPPSPVCKFEDGSEHLESYLQALTVKLNSNEEFKSDDTFSMETTFICTPGPGCVNGKQYKPSAAAVRGISKRSRVTFKNKSELFCTRAIVTMKACVDSGSQDANYKNATRTTHSNPPCQGTSPISWGSRTSMRNTQTSTISGCLTQLPTQSDLHWSTTQADLHWTHSVRQDHMTHQRRWTLWQM